MNKVTSINCRIKVSRKWIAFAVAYVIMPFVWLRIVSNERAIEIAVSMLRFDLEWGDLEWIKDD